MVQQFACRLIPGSLLVGAKYSCISPPLRIANTFSLEVDSVELEATGNNIRLYLEPKIPLISADKPLPPRGDMHEYFAPTSRLSRIIRQTNYCVIL
jgi:hypothetical protein